MMNKTIFPIHFFLVCLLGFGLGIQAQETNKIPAINQQIKDYVSTTIGKKVDRGECWDLANKALTRVNAAWTFPTQFGREVQPLKDTIYPGDLIQFTQVKLKSKNGETWTFPKHTAIVYEVLSPGVYRIAEQNVNGKRKVQIDELNYADKVSGKMIFYRPQAKK